MKFTLGRDTMSTLIHLNVYDKRISHRQITLEVYDDHIKCRCNGRNSSRMIVNDRDDVRLFPHSTFYWKDGWVLELRYQSQGNNGFVLRKLRDITPSSIAINRKRVDADHKHSMMKRRRCVGDVMYASHTEFIQGVLKEHVDDQVISVIMQYLACHFCNKVLDETSDPVHTSANTGTHCSACISSGADIMTIRNQPQIDYNNSIEPSGDKNAAIWKSI